MILVVDDNAVTMKVIRTNLERAGLETLCAENGQEALAGLAAHPEVDVVVTDISMPDMDGFGFMSEVRRHPEWSDLQIIVVSATRDRDVVKAAALYGVRRFLLKPIVATELVNEVREALGDVGGVRLEEPQAVIDRLGVSSEQYEALLADLAASLDAAIAELDVVVAGGPDVLVERFSRAVDEVGRASEHLRMLTRGEFLGVLQSPEKGARPHSVEDWFRAALRELRRVRGQVEARRGGGTSSEPSLSSAGTSA